MKHVYLRFLSLCLLSVVGAKALAHDIEAVNDDGVTIYYNWINYKTELEVTGGSSSYSGSVVIPESVTYDNKTYSVTSIGYWSFLGCSGLTSVAIPNSVTRIESDAFGECSGLTSIIVEDGNSKYDSRDNCNAIIETASNTLIAGCSTTVIPNSVSSIGSYAFDGCSGLTSITIPNSVISISDRAFIACSGLASVTIPNSVTSIGELAFALCYGLTSVTIGNSVTSIDSGAFQYCSGLTSVTIGNSVTSIGSDAFSDCSGLTSVTIPNSVTSIGEGAFSGCSVTSITIPNSVTSISEGAFGGFGLTSIIVENGNSIYDSRDNCNAIIETASNKLIAGCSTTVIPNSVTSIGVSAFRGCSSLTSITIPNSVTSIGNKAFSFCYDLTSVTIGSSVTSIGKYAFEGCSCLTDVYCYAENVPSSAYAFNSRDISNATLHVPANSIESYKSQEPWSGFKEIVALGTNKCATPTISFADGKLSFSCETEDVTYTYNITNDDITGGNAAEVQLTGVYKVTVYASKEGYDDSDVATVEIPMNVSNGLRGDLNEDGSVNALDVQEVINIAADE